MLKSMNFFRGKSRGRVIGGTKLALLAPVILGPVPRIFWQRVSNLVNKLVLLLHKCWFSVFSASTLSVILRRYSLPEVPWRRIHNAIAKAMSICVAAGNKVRDTRLPQPAGCGDKYDVSGLDLKHLLNTCCSFFKYPSPDAKASPSPAGGEGLHRPWCHKILGTDCASRPRMTGGRDANSSGRSMIEMLGVLAIIGVLSVGGIAGYSKAMEKFKVNKWVDDVVTLIANLNTTYANSKNFTEIHEKNLTDFFEELNIIPENMLDEQNRDIFGNELQISSHIPSHSEFGSRFFLYFWTLPNNDSVDECKALFDIAAQYEGSWAAVLNETESGKLGGTYSVCGKSAPDSYAEWINCQSYNTADIAQNCAVCAKQNCDINLIIHNGI